MSADVYLEDLRSGGEGGAARAEGDDMRALRLKEPKVSAFFFTSEICLDLCTRMRVR